MLVCALPTRQAIPALRSAAAAPCASLSPPSAKKDFLIDVGLVWRAPRGFKGRGRTPDIPPRHRCREFATARAVSLRLAAPAGQRWILCIARGPGRDKSSNCRARTGARTAAALVKSFRGQNLTPFCLGLCKARGLLQGVRAGIKASPRSASPFCSAILSDSCHVGPSRSLPSGSVVRRILHADSGQTPVGRALRVREFRRALRVRERAPLQRGSAAGHLLVTAQGVTDLVCDGHTFVEGGKAADKC